MVEVTVDKMIWENNVIYLNQRVKACFSKWWIPSILWLMVFVKIINNDQKVAIILLLVALILVTIAAIV